MACSYNRSIIQSTDTREIQFDKEILVYNEETLNIFLSEAFPSFTQRGWSTAGRSIDDAFTLISIQNPTVRIYNLQRFGLSPYDFINDNLAKPEGNGQLKQSNVFRPSIPLGIPQRPDGRINLGLVGGDKCEAGFYGFIGEIWEVKTPVYRVCYFDVLSRSRGVAANGMTEFDLIFLIEKIENGYQYFEEVRNETGPQIITNAISNLNGMGVSIIPDDIECPPGNFIATDYDFGDINSDKNEYTGVVSVTNNSKANVRVLGIEPRKNPNFSIGDFIPFNIINPSPSSGFELLAGETKKFEVKYYPTGEFGVTHEVVLQYRVQTERGIEVKGDKLTSKITARPYKLSVTCSDIDWGLIDVNNTQKNELEFTIQNNGSSDIYLVDYSIKGIDSQNFLNVNIPPTSLNSPLVLERGSIKSFKISYKPDGVYNVIHTAFIDFKFYRQNPITGFFDEPVLKEKTTTTLKAKAFKQNIDILLEEDLLDVLFTDDNGIYSFKSISKIIEKSAPIRKWKTSGLWNCVGENLYTFFTGSTFKTNNQYYLSVYNDQIGSPDSYHQFDISFGHKTGLGSKYTINNSNLKPSETMYKKYLVECYPPETSSSDKLPEKFRFKNNVNGDYVYFIQMDRDNFKHMLDPGNFQLALCPLTSSANQLFNTGSNIRVDQTSGTIFTLIDESFDTKQRETDQRILEDWYYITSGSLQHGIYNEPEDNAWGIVFPKIGLIVLDGVVLDQSCSFNTVTASIDGQNSHKLFLSISGSSSGTDVRSYSSSFYARSSEEIVKETYFCQVGLNEFNYSNNPTYFTSSLNYLRYDGFKVEPNSYITSIGLYNNAGDMIAVGKLKTPILKNRYKTYVFQVGVIIN